MLLCAAIMAACPIISTSREGALVAAGIALTSAGHYLTPSSLLIWHGIFQRLYYLPVVFAAITFGWVGGLIAALAAGAVYIPHIMIRQHHCREQ